MRQSCPKWICGRFVLFTVPSSPFLLLVIIVLVMSEEKGEVMSSLHIRPLNKTNVVQQYRIEMLFTALLPISYSPTDKSVPYRTQCTAVFKVRKRAKHDTLTQGFSYSATRSKITPHSADDRDDLFLRQQFLTWWNLFWSHHQGKHSSLNSRPITHLGRRAIFFSQIKTAFIYK